MAQAGVVRDALERGAREGRSRLDDALATRRRTDALADLGEIVLDLIRRGEIDLAELPEARALIRELDQLDHGSPDDPDPDADDLPRAPTRRRFDDRSTRDDLPSRPRRPSPGDGRPRRSAHDDDDGTVSSGIPPDRFSRRTVPVRPDNRESTTARAPTKPIKGMWRPQIDDAPPTADPPEWPERPERANRSDRPTVPDRPQRADRADRADRFDRPTVPDRPHRADRATISDRPDYPAAVADRPDRSSTPERPDRPTLPRDPTRKGGISFDEDDLADYMHPDDVPPKTPPQDPDDHDA
ncbi:MAG: hypothetical protein E6J91_09220 [Deltaproteobacteria bacterium]|nr:MAG: hypothetical protein E6J91_09220 [Deltaproteobacteria bacterium]